MPRAHSARYPLEIAMGDVVQACLDAGARRVDIAVEFEGCRSWIRIAADAPLPIVPSRTMPMTAQVAVSPSTAAGFDPITACLTQAATVSIAGTDGFGKGGAIRWEREHGATVARAEPLAEPSGHMLAGAARDVTGPVVLLEDLHDVLAYKRREGRLIEALVVRMRGRLMRGLGLGFHRHLGGRGTRRGQVTLTVNAEPVVPRDPMAPGSRVRRLRPRELPFAVEGRVRSVLAAPSIIAPVDGDPSGGRQGFFVYLRGRLIQAGGWSRLSVDDRGDAWARVSVDLPGSDVGSFGWEPRRVLFPPQLSPALRAVALEAVTGTWALRARGASAGRPGRAGRFHHGRADGAASEPAPNAGVG